MENKQEENNKIKRNIIIIICLSALIFILGIIFGMIISRYNEKINNNAKELNNNEVYKQYSINSEGNLVGDNILDITDYTITYNSATTISIENNQMKISATSGNSYAYAVLKFNNTNLETNTQYTISYYGYTTTPVNYNQVLFKYANGPSEDNYYYKQYISRTEPYLYQYTFNNENNTELYLLIYVNANIGTPNTITLNNIMINKGEYKDWEPYGVWYSETNYNEYGTIQYNDGKASTENQYYYFNGKTIEYYVDEAPYQDRYIGGETLIQNTYTNFTINATEQVESFYEDYDATFYYGRITLNYLSSDFYANFIYPTSSIDGYIKIVYDDGTEYTIPSYTLNRSFHIYDGSETNPNKVIKYVYMQFHYDQLLTITINTSLSSVQYNNGYNEGYNRGYTNGNVKGQEVGKEAGYNEGYNHGYDIGYNKGVEEDFTTNGFLTLINGIFAYPINLISNFFNFEFMGINILALVTFLITIGIVVFVIRKFK